MRSFILAAVLVVSSVLASPRIASTILSPPSAAPLVASSPAPDVAPLKAPPPPPPQTSAPVPPSPPPAASSSASALPTTASAKCPNGIRPRKEIKDFLADGEWPRLVNAVRTLQSGRAPTTYDRIVNQHITYQLDTHNYPPFFVWHRVYLREVEKQLQAIDPAIMLPYYQWSLDSQSPANSVVFEADVLGGNGAGSRGCIQDGAFANFRAFYPNRHCVSRQWDNGDSISGWHSIEAINRFVTASRSYEDLRENIELDPHGTFHATISGDMATMNSPNDFLFFLHHAYIDKIWADWQAMYPRWAKNYGGELRSGREASVTDAQAPWRTTANDVFNTRDLCYYYQPLRNRSRVNRRSFLERRQDIVVPSMPVDVDATDAVTAVAASAASVELRDLRPPRPLSDEYMIRMGYTERGRKFVHRQHREVVELCDKLNKINGYVSPCSLYHRPELLAKYIEKNGSITTASIGGKPVPLTIDAGESAQNIAASVVQQAEEIINPATVTSLVAGRLDAASVATPINHDEVHRQVEAVIGPISEAIFV